VAGVVVVVVVVGLAVVVVVDDDPVICRKAFTNTALKTFCHLF